MATLSYLELWIFLLMLTKTCYGFLLDDVDEYQKYMFSWRYMKNNLLDKVFYLG